MTWANVAMTLALVFAMSGGALAAKHYLITSTKQISPKVLKALAGRPGPAGPQGPAGAAGKDGAPGLNGKDGANGLNGKDGANGKSVVAAEEPKGGANCSEGGSSFEVEGSKVKHYACNGEEGKEGPQGPAGPQGPQGSPWTAGGTLPSKATETGMWTISQASPKVSNAFYTAPISFAIPLKGKVVVNQYTGEKEEVGIEEEHLYYVKTGETAPAACKDASGVAPSSVHPEAAPGNLCVFAALEQESPTLFVIDPTGNHFYAATSGALLATGALGLTNFFVSGTFAVTAE